MHPKTAARQLALRALVKSESHDLVAPDFRELDEGVRPFARELYSGTQRQRALLDWTLAPLLSKPLAKLDAPVRAALRLAIYEKLVLQTPPHGFVGEYAGLMRDERKTSAVGFVNAILRRLPDAWRALPVDLPQRLAVEFSHPQWLVERYLKTLGEGGAAALLRASNERAPLCLRANTLRVSRELLLKRWPGARPGLISPDAIVVEASDPTRLDGWDDGDFFAQDEAAQMVAHLAAPRAGDRVLDLAGAPGGKATHCAQLMENEGRIVSIDIAPGRLKLVRQNAARLGISILETRAADVRALAPDLARADVVLLDAPCLGTGTLRRRPDAKMAQNCGDAQRVGRASARTARCSSSSGEAGRQLGLCDVFARTRRERATGARVFGSKRLARRGRARLDERDFDARRLAANLAAARWLRRNVRRQMAPSALTDMNPLKSLLLGALALATLCPRPAPAQEKPAAPLLAVCQNGKWGFIDQTGHIQIAPTFDKVWGFSEGLCAVGVAGDYGNRSNGKPYIETRYGYINTQGKMVIAPQFGVGFFFHEGLAWVEGGFGPTGFIDKNRQNRGDGAVWHLLPRVPRRPGAGKANSHPKRATGFREVEPKSQSWLYR